jgi:hypothetical protein
MKMKTWVLWGFFWALVLAIVPATRVQAGSGAYISREDAEQVCHAEAARRLGLDFDDVGTGRMRSSDEGTYRIKWYTDLANGNNSSGSCTIDRGGNLLRFDQDGGMAGGPAGFGPVGDYPRVKVDTGGDGTFDGGRFRNVHLESVYLDMRERPTLVLRGSHEFRIAFNGEVIGASQREFTLRINGSDHGDVHGRAEIRLNPDRNEVETLDFHGTIDGSELNSSFAGRR